MFDCSSACSNPNIVSWWGRSGCDPNQPPTSTSTWADQTASMPLCAESLWRDHKRRDFQIHPSPRSKWKLINSINEAGSRVSQAGRAGRTHWVSIHVFSGKTLDRSCGPLPITKKKNPWTFLFAARCRSWAFGKSVNCPQPMLSVLFERHEEATFQ